MPVSIAGPKFYVFDSNGDPVVGAKINTYEIDGVTRKETFNGENGAANTNPVVTNSSGYADVYLDGVYAIVVTDADDNLIWSESPVTSGNELAQVWNNKRTATFASTTSFTLAGNATSIYKVGRRVKMEDTTTLYGSITACSYSSPNTTVTVSVDDAAPLTASLDYAWVYLFESGDFVEEVANIAALRGIEGRTGYNYAYLQSHTDRGDGGSGHFRWVSGAAASTYTDNGGTIIVPTGGDGSAAWLRDFVGELNVLWFGAKGDGSTDDTTAVQAAVDATPEGGCLLFPPATYKLVALASSPYTYGNSAGTAVHRAIDIDRSNITIKGYGATIYFVGYVVASSVNYAFSTSKNMTAGTLENIAFFGLTFDFDPTSDSSINKRSISLTGVAGIKVKDCFFTSSGSRAGATITLQNCSDVVIADCRWKNTTQGMNFSYVDRVNISNLHFDNFSEAIDFDRVVRECCATNVSFINGGQCWDMNSVQNSVFSGINAKDSANVIYINFKSTTPETFAEYVANDPVANYTVSKNVTVSGVSIDNCGQGGSVIFVGSDFNTDAGYVCQNITLQNIKMNESGTIQGRSVKNLKLLDIDHNSPYGDTSSGAAVIYLLKDSFTNSELSCTLQNVKLVDLQTSTDAIRVSVPKYCVMDNIHIENYPLDALDISTVLDESQISVTNSRFLRTVDTTVTGAALRLSANTGAASFEWRNNQITQYTSPIVVTSNTAGKLLPSRKVSCGDVTVSTGQNKVFQLYQDTRKSAYFGDITYSSQTLSADATNYSTLRVDNTATTVCSTSTTGGMTVGIERESGFSAPETEALVEAGEAMYLLVIAVGSGQTIKGFQINAHFIEFEKV